MEPTLLDLFIGLSPLSVLMGLLWASKVSPEKRYKATNIGLHLIASTWVASCIIYILGINTHLIPMVNEYVIITSPMCIYLFIAKGGKIENWLKKHDL